MSDSDPDWLLGQTSSPCEALVWHEVHHRQFCVLPFYENGDRAGQAHYCMYGRARSDGRFYPIPPSMYRLTLTRLSPDTADTVDYQWEAETHGHLPYCIPIHMQRVKAVVVGHDARGDRIFGLEVNGPVAPELVGPEDPEHPHGREPTVFYPDANLWRPEPYLFQAHGDPVPEVPLPLSERLAEFQTAPVAAHFCTAFRQIFVRSSTTALWDRTAALQD